MITLVKYCHFEEVTLDIFFIASSRRRMGHQISAKYKLDLSKFRLV